MQLYYATTGKLDFTNKMVDTSVLSKLYSSLNNKYLVGLELIDPKDYKSVLTTCEETYGEVFCSQKGVLPFLRTQGKDMFCIGYKNNNGFKRLYYFNSDPLDMYVYYIVMDVFEFYETLIDNEE